MATIYMTLLPVEKEIDGLKAGQIPCDLWSQENGKLIMPIMAYYQMGMSPRDKRLLEDLTSYSKKLISAKWWHNCDDEFLEL